MTSTVCAGCRETVPLGDFCTSCGRELTLVPQPVLVPAQAGRDRDAPVMAAAPAAPAPAHGGTWTILPVDRAPGLYTTEDAPVALPRPAGPAAAWNRGAAAVTVIALAVGGWLLLGTGGSHTVTGDLSLMDVSSSLSPGDSCSGQNGYDDMQPGEEVVLTDGDGKTLATSVLSEGTFDGLACVFHFRLTDVSKADFYAISTGNSVRGQQHYSFKDMVSRDWAVHLTLDDD